MAHRGILLALVSTFLFAGVDTLSKFLAHDYPVNQVVWARYTLPFLVLLALFAPRRGRQLFKTQHVYLQMLRGLLLTASTLLIVLAMQAMPLAEAHAISFIHPVLLTLLAVVLLGEQVSRRGWFAIALGFLGVIIIIRPGGALFTWIALIPLVQACLYACYQILTRHIAGIEHPINSLLYALLVGSVVLTLTLPLNWVSPGWFQGLLFLGMGLFSGVSHYCIIRAFQLAPVSVLAPFAYVQLLWVTLFGWLVFDSLPDHVSFIGMLTIAAGGLLVIFRKQPPPKNT